MRFFERVAVYSVRSYSRCFIHEIRIRVLLQLLCHFDVCRSLDFFLLHVIIVLLHLRMRRIKSPLKGNIVYNIALLYTRSDLQRRI